MDFNQLCIFDLIQTTQNTIQISREVLYTYDNYTLLIEACDNQTIFDYDKCGVFEVIYNVYKFNYTEEENV